MSRSAVYGPRNLRRVTALGLCSSRSALTPFSIVNKGQLPGEPQTCDASNVQHLPFCRRIEDAETRKAFEMGENQVVFPTYTTA